MTDKILTLLGFAAKAGKLSFGMDSSVEAIKRGKSRLTLAACDISQKSLKEINFHAKKNNVRVITLDDCNIERLSVAVGKKCGIISVNDRDFKDGIIGAVNNQCRNTEASIQGGNANE